MANSVLTLLAFLVLAAIANAQETINVPGWIIPYSGQKEFVASVGDTMIFRWAQGTHNVYLHPTGSCDTSGAVLVGTTPATSYTFTEADGGTTMFFACDIGDGSHCRAGE
jgi:plastocyanin